MRERAEKKRRRCAVSFRRRTLFADHNRTLMPFDFSEATVTSPVPDEDVTVASEKDELTLGEIINIKLVESGEKDNLMELVRDRLVESGRKDGMRVACREHVKKKGRKDVAVDELIRVITPKSRASVPDAVKQELLNRIQNFIGSAAP
ncbi:PREDICTED: transcription and mRNA export factor SUS1-like [Brassica oleracea var. oleracea]|nr:PREDICTED: transcription and mRNA export factor SUS1-like [Brassica oleracea var. oleracea]